MRTAIPPMTEHETELKQRLRRAHDGHKKLRLQMLYLLASGQAHDRQEVAHLLGVHRNTVCRWLALYAARGLHALLETYVPAGKPVSLAPAVLARQSAIESEPISATRFRVLVIGSPKAVGCLVGSLPTASKRRRRLRSSVDVGRRRVADAAVATSRSDGRGRASLVVLPLSAGRVRPHVDGSLYTVQ